MSILTDKEDDGKLRRLVRDRRLFMDLGLEQLVLETTSQDIIRILLQAEDGSRDFVFLWACRKGYKRMVDILLEKGANVHTENTAALDFAIEGGYTRIVRVLLEAGASPNVGRGRDLSSASQKGYVKIVQLLLEAGANVHAWNDTALCSASCAGHAEIVKMLLQAGANVHADNDTPLRWAAECGHLRVVEVLLGAGASIQAHDVFGYNALDLATKRGHKEVVELLERYKALSEKEGKEE